MVVRADEMVYMSMRGAGMRECVGCCDELALAFVYGRCGSLWRGDLR